MPVYKPAKSFVSNQYSDWYANEVLTQLRKGVDPCDVKINMSLTNLKPLHARWIVELYDHLHKQKDIIVKGFESAGVLEAIANAEAVMTRIENPFRE